MSADNGKIKKVPFSPMSAWISKLGEIESGREPLIAHKTARRLAFQIVIYRQKFILPCWEMQGLPAFEVALDAVNRETGGNGDAYVVAKDLAKDYPGIFSYRDGGGVQGHIIVELGQAVNLLSWVC
jgi:hypothetical protein